MSIKTELERLHEDHIEDIADGAGFYAGTNPPRKLNIAEAISGGLTTNIAKACDIFYGNEPVSQTISQAIAKGVEAGSPYKSISDILKAVENTNESLIYEFDGDFQLTYYDEMRAESVDPDVYFFLSNIKNGDTLRITVGEHTASGRVTISDYHGMNNVHAGNPSGDSYIVDAGGMYTTGDPEASRNLYVIISDEVPGIKHIKVEIIS